MAKPVIEKFQREDAAYLSRRSVLAERLSCPDLWRIADHFGLYAGVQTLGSRMAVFEIMKECLHVPGHIVEFGCWSGANLIFMAKALQLLQPNSYRHVYGFDSFEGLKTFSRKDGGVKAAKGKYRGSEIALRTVIEFFGMEDWVHLVKGDALKTIPRFERENPHMMFSLAYIDFDLYRPCKAALEYAGRRVSPGGIIVLDEALTNLWPGEGTALVEFLSKSGAGRFSMKSVAFARQPTAYLIKK